MKCGISSVAAYGWATHGVRTQPHHRFRIASVTKILTAAGVMKLVEQGRLSVADKVFGPKGGLTSLLVKTGL